MSINEKMINKALFAIKRRFKDDKISTVMAREYAMAALEAAEQLRDELKEKRYSVDEVTAMHHDLWDRSRAYSEMLGIATEALEYIVSDDDIGMNCHEAAKQALKQIQGTDNEQA